MRPVRSAARGVALTLAAAVIVCGGWLLLAPRAVGGPASLVITSGISMQPTFHTGDLAVLHASSGYHVGDVVGYRSRTLHGAVVMHRIVAAQGTGDATTFTTKGDHNTWLDPDHPTRADVVGRLWLHVPKGGFVLTRVLLPLAFVAFLVVLLPMARRGKDENGDPTETAYNGKHDAKAAARAGRYSSARAVAIRPAPDGLSRALAAGVSLAIAGAAIAVIGYALPTSRSAPSLHSWQRTVDFGWTGTAPAGDIYPSGRVTQPEPVFTKLVHRLTLTAAVTASGRALSAPTLTATLSDGSGWARSWQLDTAAGQHDAAVRLQGDVDLDRLIAEVTFVQALTGVTSQPSLTLTVSEAGERASSALPFTLNRLTFKPQDKLSLRTSGSTSGHGSAPDAVHVSGHSISVSTLRHVGPFAALAGLLTALVAGVLGSRAGPPDAQQRLQRAFSGRVVRLTDRSILDRPGHDVSDPESLAAFATVPSAVLYVVELPGGTALVAQRGDTLLRYVPQPATSIAAIPAPRSATADTADTADTGDTGDTGDAGNETAPERGAAAADSGPESRP